MADAKTEIRPLEEGDLDAAAACNRAAFSKFLAIPEPDQFRSGADVIGARWRAWPEGAHVLTADGALVGVGLMMNWGSICILGPLTIVPEHWGAGYARQLMGGLIDVIERNDFTYTGLFTHPSSPTHIRLYESFGFAMQRITAVMAKPAEEASMPEDAALFSEAPDAAAALARARALTAQTFAGLALDREIGIVAELGIGETVLLQDARGLLGLAVCQHGPGSEANADQLLVKFATVTPGDRTSERFARLLSACEALAVKRGAATIVAGTNTGRADAYRVLQEAGFRTEMNGVAMTRPATDGYNDPETFAIDDWR